MPQPIEAHRFGRGLYGMVLLASLAGCTAHRPLHDEQAHLTRNDARRLMEAPDRPDPPVAPPIPELIPADLVGQAPMIAPDKLVTVAVTEAVPLKDVFVAMARQAKVDLELDPRIQGGVIFMATNRPFQETAERLAELAGLRTRISPNRIKVELDEPYPLTYRLPYLAQSRVSTATNTLTTQIVGGFGSASSAADSTSATAVSSTAKADLYAELEEGLRALLRTTRVSGTPGGVAGDASEGVTINRLAGLVTVVASERQHRTLGPHLRRLAEASQAQVAIEAKLVEVVLNDRYQAGVDWSGMIRQAGLGTVTVNQPFGLPASATDQPFSVSLAGGDVDALVNLLGRFGTARTLSAPRVTILNNQTALLKVAENRVFFELEVQREDNLETDRQRITVNSIIRTVPVGLLLSVQPSIDTASNQVVLGLRPTVTRIVGQVPNPGVAIESDGRVRSDVPIVDVRELDSVMRLSSGQVGVLGGLMQQRVANEDSGIPGLSELPGIGRMFKSRDEEGQLTELVVLLRAQILPAEPAGSLGVTEADRRLYQGYFTDPRPAPLPRL